MSVSLYLNAFQYSTGSLLHTKANLLLHTKANDTHCNFPLWYHVYIFCRYSGKPRVSAENIDIKVSTLPPSWPLFTAMVLTNSVKDLRQNVAILHIVSEGVSPRCLSYSHFDTIPLFVKNLYTTHFTDAQRITISMKAYFLNQCCTTKLTYSEK